MSGRTVLMVDGAYMMKARPGHFDYVSLKLLLERELGTTFVESFFFNSVPEQPSAEQSAFHTWLKTAPPHGPCMRVMLYKLKELHTRLAAN